MAMREKDQSDFDLETFVDLFDTAMSSDNPAVQRALKNLVLISAIVNAQENPDSIRRGPLRKMVDDILSIRKRLDQLESAGAYRSTYKPQPITTWTDATIPAGYKYPSIHPGTTIDTYQTQAGANNAALSSIDIQVGSLLDKLEAK